MSEPLRIALSKGRILEQTLPMFAAIGLRPKAVAGDGDGDGSRRLILPTTDPNVEFVIIRATDVPTFVEHGAAALGVAGKDVLLEHSGDGLYEPLDLGIARCRLALAGRLGQGLPGGEDSRLRVATKYVKSARNYFAGKGMQVELIKLYGSMELAPLVGLADYIVDLVDTGSTLRANGLEPLETITAISSRLIVNKAAMKMHHRKVTKIIDSLADFLGGAR